MATYLEFEKPIAELDGKIAELKHVATGGDINIADEVAKLQSKTEKLLKATYAKLTPWQKTLVARHPERPHFRDYVAALVTDFVPLAGDRAFADDRAIQGGLGRLRGRPVMIMGHEKGDDTQSRVRHNFGMAKPEGYRKAIRLMQLAERFELPVVTLVDTPGAYPGVEAEARGQAEAIARSIETCLKIKVPLVSAIIGEGGSGGAIAIATANRVLMLENAIYAVASPEASASILWKDAARAQDAANNMKITAQDLLGFGVIDGIIPEPAGGAHRHANTVMTNAATAISTFLRDFPGTKSRLQVREERREKFMAIGSTLN